MIMVMMNTTFGGEMRYGQYPCKIGLIFAYQIYSYCYFCDIGYIVIVCKYMSTGYLRHNINVLFLFGFNRQYFVLLQVQHKQYQV
jgi:hypothetical protein